MSRTRGILVSAACAALSAVALAPALAGSQAQAQTPVTTPAQTPTTQTPVQREHVVKKGDTLWDLAQFYYGNPFLWTIIYNANRPVVANPHWIFPVEKLLIPGRDTTTAPPLGIPVPPVVEVTVQPLAIEPKDTTPTLLGTPELRKPFVTATEYLSAPWLSMDPQSGVSARIMRMEDPTENDDKIPQQLYPNDRVILGGLRGSFRQGDSVQVVRMGRKMGAYGQLVEPLGVLRVDSVGATIVVATLVRHFGTAKIGDFVMAMGAPLQENLGDYSPVSAGPEGKLLEFLDIRTLHGTDDVAFISLGSDQVRIGDELDVYTPEQKINSQRPEILPNTAVGVVRVVKVSDHSATVRVMSVRNTGLHDGLPARLVRRAP